MAFGLVALALAFARPALSEPLTIFYTSELYGTLEPCGCTTDPLGDWARLLAIVGTAKDRVWVDGGHMLYPKGVLAPGLADARHRRAKLVRDTAKEYHLAISRPDKPRVLSGRTPAPPPLPRAPRVVVVGRSKIGVFSDVDARNTDEVTSQAMQLRQEGAEVVVALLGTRPEARRTLLSARGIDIGVVSREVSDGDPLAEIIAGSLLVQPADQGRRLGVLKLFAISQEGAWIDAGGESAARARIAKMREEKRHIEAKLVEWSNDKEADPAFVAAKRADIARLAEEMQRLEKAPFTPPRAGRFFTNELVEIRRHLPRDKDIAKRIDELNRDINKTNFENARELPPPKVPPGALTYVGAQKCGEAGCHPQALAFWKSTRHARAWRTLVRAEKQYDYECIGCHVTGYEKPGGATLGHHQGRLDVQCEVCHGPASKHVAEEGLEDTPSVVRKPDLRMCAAECHTKEHSDTFEINAYLRDILGEGHAMKRRTELGRGPTGRELRAAGLSKAKAQNAKK